MIDAVRALTLWPEWLPAFQHLGKRIENRGWAPPPALIGQRIALHAGASLAGGSPKKIQWFVDTAAECGWRTRIDRAERRLFWRPARLSALGEVEQSCPIVTGAVVATARLIEVGRFEKEPWAIPGQIHWRFGDFDWLAQPVPMKGLQKLWKLKEAA